MITTKKYLKALKIVNAYHEQMRLESQQVKQIVEKTQFRDLEVVEPNEFVQCIFVHSASSFTKDKKYEVLRVDDNRFMIENDNGKKKWHYKTNQHFKLI